MALVVLPSFAALTRAMIDALRLAFVQQLGGVHNGVLYPGNLDAANIAASPGFRNDQKLEARSPVSWVQRPSSTDGSYAPGFKAGSTGGPWPTDVDVFAVQYVRDAAPGGAGLPETGTLIVYIGNERQAPLPLPSPAGRQIYGGKLDGRDMYEWTVAYTIPAGATVRVSTSLSAAPTSDTVAPFVIFHALARHMP